MNAKSTRCRTCGGQVSGLVFGVMIVIVGILPMVGKSQTERRQQMTTTRDVASSPADEGSSTKGGEHTLTFTDQNFDQEVVQAQMPVLVDFWAEWCSPCRALGPTIDELAVDYAGKIKVGKVDADANSEISARYGVSSIPAVFLFVNGEIKEKFVGLRSKKDYQAVLDQFVG